jgi:chemotaxis protein histidine kinase CheA
MLIIVPVWFFGFSLLGMDGTDSFFFSFFFAFFFFCFCPQKLAGAPPADRSHVAGHVASVAVREDNPDTLTPLHDDRANLDDTSFLKTADTDTDSVPESVGMHSPSSGFGTATVPNDESVGYGTAPGTGASAVGLSDDIGYDGGEEGADPAAAVHTGALEDAGKLDLLVSADATDDLEEALDAEDDEGEDDEGDAGEDEDIGVSDVLLGDDPLASMDPLHVAHAAPVADPIPANKESVLAAPVPVPEIGGMTGDNDVVSEAAAGGEEEQNDQEETSQAAVAVEADAEDGERAEVEADEDEDEGENEHEDEEGEDEDEDEEDEEDSTASAMQSFLSDAASRLESNEAQVSSEEREAAADRIRAAQSMLASAAEEDGEDEEDEEDHEDEDEDEDENEGAAMAAHVVKTVPLTEAEAEAKLSVGMPSSDLTANTLPDAAEDLLFAPEPATVAGIGAIPDDMATDNANVDVAAMFNGDAARGPLVTPGGDYEPAQADGDSQSSMPLQQQPQAVAAVDCSGCQALLPAARAFVFHHDLKGDRNRESIAALCAQAPAGREAVCAATLARFGISPLAFHLKETPAATICASFALCDRADLPGADQAVGLRTVVGTLIEGYAQFPQTAYKKFWKVEEQQQQQQQQQN